jgi:hypothetical protein
LGWTPAVPGGTTMGMEWLAAPPLETLVLSGVLSPPMEPAAESPPLAVMAED